MKQSDEAKRRELFCIFMARGFSPEESVRRAGYGAGDCGRQSAALLGDAKVRRRISRLMKDLCCRAPEQTARAGLERLALGDVGGVLALLGDEETFIRNADLFHVAELRRPKGGGIELKFYDRLRALSLLAEMGAGGDSAAGSLLSALEKSARAVGSAEDA